MGDNWIPGPSGGSRTTSRSSSNSSWWPDFLSNNPVSEAVGHVDNWIAHAAEPHGNQRIIPDFLASNAVTSVPYRFVAGPHQLVDFATHDWIAGLIALGETAASPNNHFFGPGLYQPKNLEHPIASFEHDVHSKDTLAGVGIGLAKSYNQKYRFSASASDLLQGKFGTYLNEQEKVAHNVAQDPFGTALDFTVAGKALDAAALGRLAKASEAGKLPEGSLRARIADRILTEDRTMHVHPSTDLYGNPYVGAKGVIVEKSFRSRGVAGRLLQSYMDQMRLALPESIPFSAHRLGTKEYIRQVSRAFERNSFHIRQAAHLINQLPEGLQYAVQFVAELPRDVLTIGHDPIGTALDFFKSQRPTLEKLPDNRMSRLQKEALDHRIQVLERVNESKDAIYDPNNPLAAQFEEAYNAAHEADQLVLQELVRRNLVSQATLDAQDMLVHRLYGGVRYHEGGLQSDVLGSYDGGLTTAQAQAQQQAALDSYARGGGAGTAVHRYEIPGGGTAIGRSAVLIDKRTGEIHIADHADHSELARAMGISDYANPAVGTRFVQGNLSDAIPEYDIPRHWQVPPGLTAEMEREVAGKLQQIEPLPVYTHTPGGELVELIPARAGAHGPPVVHRYPLPQDAVHGGRVAALIDRRTGEIHLAEPTGTVSAEGRAASAPSAAWHADLGQAAGIHPGDLKDHFIQASTGDAVPSLDIPRRWILPSGLPPAELDRIVNHLQQIENLPVETGDFEGMIPARATGEPLHNPLARFGPSWHWPNEPFAVVGAPVGMLPRAADAIRSVFGEEPRSEALANIARGANKQRPGDVWIQGLINSHPEALNTAIFDRWSQIRAKDFVDEFLYPMSGRLESGPGYEQGGKLANESYILAPPHLVRGEPLVSKVQHWKTLDDLLNDFHSLHQKDGETTEAWINRLDEHGLRRVKTSYVKKWEREVSTAKPIFQKIVHGGINQIWRFLLLGIKPGWAIANYYTNQALVWLKNAGRGGMQAYLAMVKDAVGHSRLRRLYEYTKRMDLSPETKAEVQKIIDDSLHNEINRQEGSLHYSTFGKQRFLTTPRAGRAVPPDALTPQGRLFVRMAKHPEYTLRRAGHMLAMPARFVERINQVGEEFTRDQAYLAKLYQMTGKMAHSAEELRQIMRDSKIKGNKDKMEELLMGPNGAMDALGDYSRMSATEREYISGVMPFYPWYKTILGISARFFARDTGRVWILHNIAQSLSNVAAQDMQLGVPVPSFAKDLQPLFPPHGDYQLTMSTRTWNPFQTPVDIGNNLAAFATRGPTATPNEVGLGLFGPAIQGAYTATTGKDPFYGGNYAGWGSGQGRLGATVGSFFYGLPQKRLYDMITGDYKSKVFASPPGQSPVPGLNNAGYVGLLQYLGVPVKYVNLPNLQTRAIEEGQKPPRRPAARKASGDNWIP